MRRPEQQIQRMIVRGLRVSLPSGWIVKADRGNPRNKIAGSIDKSLGALDGWPDLEVIGRDARDRPCTWHLEVKAPRGRVQKNQHEVHDALRDLGRPVAVVRSWEETMAIAREWGWPLRCSQ